MGANHGENTITHCSTQNSLIFKMAFIFFSCVRSLWISILFTFLPLPCVRFCRFFIFLSFYNTKWEIVPAYIDNTCTAPCTPLCMGHIQAKREERKKTRHTHTLTDWNAKFHALTRSTTPASLLISLSILCICSIVCNFTYLVCRNFEIGPSFVFNFDRFIVSKHCKWLGVACVPYAYERRPPDFSFHLALFLFHISPFIEFLFFSSFSSNRFSGLI